MLRKVYLLCFCKNFLREKLNREWTEFIEFYIFCSTATAVALSKLQQIMTPPGIPLSLSYEITRFPFIFQNDFSAILNRRIFKQS